MRVIAGTLSGRVFDAPPGNRTHPMSDRIRGALFNALGDISGMTVLDAYSGSGALAIEAISRGARRVEAIDIDKKAADTIQNNIDTLDIGSKMKVTRANIIGWSGNNPAVHYDIVFIDQPYDKTNIGDIQTLAKHVNGYGLLVLSWPGNLEQPELDVMRIVKHKSFGDAQLIFYKPK